MGTALIVWGLKVVSNSRALIFENRTQEEIDADKNRLTAAGIMREHEWAVTWGVWLLLSGLTLAVVVAVCQAVS